MNLLLGRRTIAAFSLNERGGKSRQQKAGDGAKAPTSNSWCLDCRKVKRTDPE